MKMKEIGPRGTSLAPFEPPNDSSSKICSIKVVLAAKAKLKGRYLLDIFFLIAHLPFGTVASLFTVGSWTLGMFSTSVAT